jgi:PadR family transcriptional regulator PadR
MENIILRDIFLALIKVHILYHAGQGEVYGVGLINELARHGYRIGPGTLYPLLHTLEAGGLLVRNDRLVDSRVRKYYHLTRTGSEALAETRGKLRELYEEVFEDA